MDQLLDLTRIERGALTISRESMDVAALIHQAVAVVQVTAPQHVIQVSPESDTPIYADIDPVRLEQLIINLADNAAKYTSAGTPISVELTVETANDQPNRTEEMHQADQAEETRQREQLVLTVSDAGPGIPTEHRAHIFDPFYRGDPNTSLSGMGLGLYLCAEIVAADGGEISATYPQAGGTTITIRLPRHASGPAAS